MNQKVFYDQFILKFPEYEIDRKNYEEIMDILGKEELDLKELLNYFKTIKRKTKELMFILSCKMGKAYLCKYFRSIEMDEKIYLSTLSLNFDSIKYIIENHNITYLSEYLSCGPCIQGDLKTLKYLIEKGMKIQKEVLLDACKSGNIEMVKYLIENDEKKQFYYNNTLNSACKSGNQEMVGYIEKYDQNYEESIEGALKSNNIKILEYILSKNEFDYVNLIYLSVEQGNLNLVKFFREKYLNVKFPSYVLNSLNEKCSIELIDYLILNGANHYEYLLQNVCFTGDFNLVQNVFNKYLINYPLGHKSLDSALENSAQFDNVDLVKFLVSKGARSLVQSLFKACSLGNINVAEYLISIGKINSKIIKIFKIIK